MLGTALRTARVMAPRAPAVHRALATSAVCRAEVAKKRMSETPVEAAPPPKSPASSVQEKRNTVSERLQKRAAKKAAMTITPTAVEHIRALQNSASGPKLIRVGVRNKGCAGMSYHLEYIAPEEAGRFDERVVQDGVEVLIDSRALFSIIGSEMDWKEDKLSAKFVFNNPNVKDACGCGESFMT
ncbi:Iron-sulfur assembly protein 1 [Malassezia obtusa]|uniref:Iron-sulfur assembly protein 1 n=1 Tax=Malassezia obtusa TaxID=76774 RepID=A0AAF0E3L3_9BASI|nr:Iron-sulfur assembly protein 1 [Malassezia obtusa]